jgi:hypothetical protein
MDNRLKSAIAVALIHGVLGYVLFMGTSVPIRRQTIDTLTMVSIAPERAPPKPPRSPPPTRVSAAAKPVVLHDWALASPYQRNQDFIKTAKWVKDNLSAEDRRFAKWRAVVPQGTGSARVTRLRPPNLTTHTLYWPASWSKGALPIIAWGNGADNMCSNNSLPFAAFLSEIASHGYFVVAVGNDDIDYPPPDGLGILADGRPIRTQASALTKAVDWAIAENSRPGSPYERKLDTSKIAYMGYACGGQQAMAASSDPRTTTTVLLNAAARFSPDSPDTHKASIAQFEGGQDDGGVRDVGDANFARAQAAGWPMYKATLESMSRDGPYPGPDRRWSKAVIAWLDWQLKGDSDAATTLSSLRRDGWSRIDATGL